MRTDAFDRFFRRNSPPGMDYAAERRLVCAGLGVAVLWSFSGLLRFDSLFSLSREGEIPVRVFTRQEMPPFTELFRGSMLIFLALMLATVALAAWRYAYFIRDSRSIWLMRRLSRRGEVSRRVVIIPLIYLIFAALLSLVLILIYFRVYIAGTPAHALPAGQWEALWSNLWEVFL